MSPVVSGGKLLRSLSLYLFNFGPALLGSYASFGVFYSSLCFCFDFNHCSFCSAAEDRNLIEAPTESAGECPLCSFRSVSGPQAELQTAKRLLRLRFYHI